MANSTHPLRIFGVSGAITLITLIVVWVFMGPQAAMLAAILCVIEITFSFDNAIINARVLKTLSPFWQQLFLTVGILIAVFGMRLVFPIAIVAATTSLDWQQVLNLALNDPTKYAHALEGATPLITAFGGSFLMMLGLHFFFDWQRTVTWLALEKPLLKMHSNWLPAVITLLVLIGIVIIPEHPDWRSALVAGISGIVTYLVVHGLSEAVGHSKSLTGVKHKVGLAAFWTFLYLEVLDASFSFDGVIGAFAVTSDVIIIAAGLGVGAFWVRSLTIYMVRKQVLDQYKFLEHGAHYTILILSIIMLLSVFFHLPEVVPGLLGISVIGASVYASIRHHRRSLP